MFRAWSVAKDGSPSNRVKEAPASSKRF